MVSKKIFSLLVFDIGKTNIKVIVLGENGVELYSKSAANTVINKKPYPHFDEIFIWEFLVNGMREAARLFSISHICVAAHGAAVALVNPDEKKTGLVLPIMDYEWESVNEYDQEYSELRPSFSKSFSPNLPQGLNLGRQLFWQSKAHKKEFSKAKYILPLAQYWAWRLSGVAATEVSTLGCHTDLWSPHDDDFSTLVYGQNWQSKFPQMLPAWAELGPIRTNVSDLTGLSLHCKVLTGAHDSNASLSRFLKPSTGQRPIIVSTGTWVITMNHGGDVSRLAENRDMLANIDVEGKAVCCARFMGGREYAEICNQLGGEVEGSCTEGDVQDIIDQDIFALPDFANGSGPYGGQNSKIIGKPKSPNALAALYCALMIDLELELLNADGPIVIEGSFAHNAMICNLVSAIRPKQEVYKLAADSGVAQGCLSLALWHSKTSCTPNVNRCPEIKLDSLGFYRNQWRAHCEINPRIENA